MLGTLDAENQRIVNDLGKFALKVLESPLDNGIKKFIHNREELLQASDAGTRLSLSSLGAEILIGLYDEVRGKKIKVPEIACFLADCLFGLWIMSELDGVGSGGRRLRLVDY